MATRTQEKITLEPERRQQLPNFKQRLEWFRQNRPDLRRNVVCRHTKGIDTTRRLAIVPQNRLKQVLQKMLDEPEFSAECGVRAVSRYHTNQSYIFEAGCRPVYAVPLV